LEEPALTLFVQPRRERRIKQADGTVTEKFPHHNHHHLDLLAIFLWFVFTLVMGEGLNIFAVSTITLLTAAGGGKVTYLGDHKYLVWESAR
jgi:hypothetical protein